MINTEKKILRYDELFHRCEDMISTPTEHQKLDHERRIVQVQINRLLLTPTIVF